MVDLSSLLTDEDLRRRYGTPTLDRAWDYVRRGKVLSCEHSLDSEGDLDINGAVSGTTSAPYAVRLSVGVDGEGVWIFGRCSCPVHDGCKHALALLITVRDEHSRKAPDHGRRWERQLSSLLDELDERAERTRHPGDKPLALQLDLKRPTPGGQRGYAGWSSGSSSTSSTRGTLRVRPMKRGARDNWVRSNIAWTTVPYLDRHGHPAEQAAALNDLLSAHRAATRQMYFGADAHISLGTFGPDEVALLRRATDVGVTILAGPGLSHVELADPVELRLDVNGAPGEDARLQVGAPLGDEWYSAGDLDVLGEGGHAVALWLADGDAWSVTLAALATPPGPELRRLLRHGDSFVVPASDRDDLVAEYLPRLQRHVPVVSSDGTVVLPEPPEPRLVLAVTWVAADEVRVAWTWHYRVGSEDRVYALSETRGLRGVRRPEAEQAALDALVLDDEQAYHLCRAHRRDLGLEDGRTFRDTHAILFAEALLPGLREQVEVEEIGRQPDYRELDGAPVIHFATRESSHADATRTDWLDLEVEVTVDGTHIALAHVMEAMTKGMDRVILRNGQHVRIDGPEFARLAELVEAAAELRDQPAESVRLSHEDLHLWDELAEVGIVDEQAARWVRAAQALRSLDSLPEVDPVGLKADLRSYQRDGFRWLAYLWQTQLGGILADDMGLGKTLQALALVAYARDRGADPFLVVAPTSVVGTWAHEAAQFTPGLVVRVVSESQARRGESVASLAEGADLVVTSYTLFRLEQTDYVSLRWGGLVLDEAQAVKNHHGKTYQAVRRVDVPFRLALTGTPMENRLMELWSLLSIVAPGLYPWPQRFVETVANPVERAGDREVLERFRRRIRPFLLRRTKELVAADLPPKQEQVLEVSLTPRHRAIYETHLQRERQAVLGLVDDFDRHRIAIFRSLTRLRQLSLDAALVGEEYDGVGSAKVDVLVDHLLEVAAEGHRALVFSQFTSFLRRVRDRLDLEGLASSYLDGRSRRRGEIIDGFRKGDDPVFLISLKAGGVGLTLVEADYVFVLDPWWNPAVEAQAVDRTHRIGQQRQVFVYRLVATDTIEEKVMALKARKAALFAQVVDDDALMSAPLGADDVRELFD